MAVICAHRQEPNWQPEDGRTRYVVDHDGGRYWVETDGPSPDIAELRRVLGLDPNPGPAPLDAAALAAEVAALKAALATLVQEAQRS